MSNLSPAALALSRAHGPGPIDWERLATLTRAVRVVPVDAVARIRRYIDFKQMQESSGHSCGQYADWQTELALSDLRAVVGAFHGAPMTDAEIKLATEARPGWCCGDPASCRGVPCPLRQVYDADMTTVGFGLAPRR